MIANPFTSADWTPVIPLLIVAATALAVLFADVTAPGGAKRMVAVAISILGLLAAALWCLKGYGDAHRAFYGGFMSGGFTVVFEEIVLAAALLSVVLFAAIGERDRLSASLALLLWSTSGAMLMAGAGNLMTIFLGLELLSLALYCLCGLSHRPGAREASLKYLILSSAASGFLLYGMALFFGASGSIALSALASPALASNPLFVAGCAMFLVAIAFKLSLVPFHVWTPDVYEGAPLPVTAFMSVATKAGTLAVFARFAYGAIGSGHAQHLLFPIWVLAAISMLVGNLAALAQTDMKRLLAYSGIAQAGYILVGLSGSSVLGLRYAIFYLGAYLFMNLGAFAVIALLSSQNEEGSRISSFAGLGFRRPALAACMTLFLLGLAGFPPTAGFIGKILILSSAVNTANVWLGGMLIAGTAISLYVYFKVIRLMYDRQAAVRHDAGTQSPLAWAGVALCAAATLILTFYPIAPSNVLPLVK